MKERVFSAEFKAERVLEVLQGEKEINEIASAHEIAPNQLRNWKNEFLANAANDSSAKSLKNSTLILI